MHREIERLKYKLMRIFIKNRDFIMLNLKICLRGRGGGVGIKKKENY